MPYATRLYPFFCRIGSKRVIINDIEPVIPEHDLYVEPFVGGGAVFFGLADDIIGNRKVISDADKELMEGYRLLKSANPDAPYRVPASVPAKQQFVNTTHTNKEDKLISRLLMTCNTFSNIGYGRIYKNYTHASKLKKIAEYKKRLQNTTILSQDYKSVIKKYDTPDTFFFLDPPYEKSGGLYLSNEKGISFPEMAEILKKIKGDFLLTINDSPEIRQIFSGFVITPIKVRGAGGKDKGIGKDILRKELFITNYILDSK